MYLPVFVCLSRLAGGTAALRYMYMYQPTPTYLHHTPCQLMEPCIDMPAGRKIQDDQCKKLKRIRVKKDAAAAEVVQADLYSSLMEQVVDDSLWKAHDRKSLQQRMSLLPHAHINQVRFCAYVPRWRPRVLAGDLPPLAPSHVCMYPLSL